MLPSGRLEYVVVPMPKGDKVKRLRHSFKTGKGIIREEIEEPAGFMVYFPRGHALRFKDEAALRNYGLHKKPRIVNMQDMADPNTPMGKLIAAQTEEQRAQAYVDLEAQVIALATVKTGRAILLRDGTKDTEERIRDGGFEYFDGKPIAVDDKPKSTKAA